VSSAAAVATSERTSYRSDSLSTWDGQRGQLDDQQRWTMTSVLKQQQQQQLLKSVSSASGA